MDSPGLVVPPAPGLLGGVAGSVGENHKGRRWERGAGKPLSTTVSEISYTVVNCSGKGGARMGRPARHWGVTPRCGGPIHVVYVREGKPLKWRRVGRLCLKCREFSPDGARPARKGEKDGGEAVGGQ